MKPRLLLIFPESYALGFGDMRFIRRIYNRFGILPAGPPTVAALAAGVFQVRIVDEAVESVPYDQSWDIVGLTGFHLHVESARRIAQRFRSKGVLVVSGGPSVSVSPQRWRPFSDVIFVGEAERTWPRFVRDWLSGAWHDEYREEGTADMHATPVPDYSGYPRGNVKRYSAGIVQTSRGCPFQCEFCNVIVYSGRKMRYKSAEQVVAEVRQLSELGLRFTMLADDNFAAGRKMAKRILRALKEWNCRQRSPMIFGTQLSIDCAGDEEFLELAAEAGLTRVLIGIESPNTASLVEAKKFQNVRSDIAVDVRAFNEHGIMVVGTSIVGFDHDDLTVFRKQYQLFQDAAVLIPEPFPLQVMDGTALKERLVREGRYRDWEPTVASQLANAYNTFTIIPKLMSVKELEQGFQWLARELWNAESTVERMARWVDHWNHSPKCGRLAIPPFGMRPDDLGVLARMGAHQLFSASTGQRRAFRELARLAFSCDHTQAVANAALMYLVMLNVQRMVYQLNPAIDTVSYPARMHAVSG